jgi:hypothetical protein
VARSAFSFGPELRVNLLHRGLEICTAFSIGGAIFLRPELSRIGDSCHFPLYETAMAGGRRSQEREIARKIRSFDSGCGMKAIVLVFQTRSCVFFPPEPNPSWFLRKSSRRGLSKV